MEGEYTFAASLYQDCVDLYQFLARLSEYAKDILVGCRHLQAETGACVSGLERPVIHLAKDL